MVSGGSEMIDEGKLWSLIRDVLKQGAAIYVDHESLGYERYSARLDAAASFRVAKFVELMGGEWISTADRLPEDGQAVAFVVDCKPGSHMDYLDGRVLGGMFKAGKFGGFSVPGLQTAARYWMPLPDAPKDGEGSRK